MAHRPAADLDVLAETTPATKIGIGMIDNKVNHIETSDKMPHIEKAVAKTGPDRLGAAGLRLLDAQASIADRKMAALVAGRERFLGR